jgi:hypothetical protein
MYMTVASERSRRRLFDLGSITNAHFRTELGPTREAHFDQAARSERVFFIGLSTGGFHAQAQRKMDFVLARLDGSATRTRATAG